MGKATRKRKPKIDDRMPPTAEQMARADFHSAGMAYKRVAVIDTMLQRDQITPQEHQLLAYYRDQASLADSSPLKSCIDFSVKGGDMGPSAAITSAILETARIERDMGQLWPLARSVAVNDMTIAQWCIDRCGGRERYDGKGKFIAVVPIGEARAVKLAVMELRMAARRIVK